MKSQVNLNIDKDVWEEFRKHIQDTGMSPSFLIEFVMRSVGTPQAAGVEKMLDGMFNFLMEKSKEFDKKKKKEKK